MAKNNTPNQANVSGNAFPSQYQGSTPAAGRFNTTGMYGRNPSGLMAPRPPGQMYPRMPVPANRPPALQGQPFPGVQNPNPVGPDVPIQNNGPMPDFGANPTGGLSPSQQALLQLMMMYSNPNRTPTSNG